MTRIILYNLINKANKKFVLVLIIGLSAMLLSLNFFINFFEMKEFYHINTLMLFLLLTVQFYILLVCQQFVANKSGLICPSCNKNWYKFLSNPNKAPMYVLVHSRCPFCNSNIINDNQTNKNAARDASHP